jgi:hypothetical protein
MYIVYKITANTSLENLHLGRYSINYSIIFSLNLLVWYSWPLGFLLLLKGQDYQTINLFII